MPSTTSSSNVAATSVGGVLVPRPTVLSGFRLSNIFRPDTDVCGGGRGGLTSRPSTTVSPRSRSVEAGRRSPSTRGATSTVTTCPGGICPTSRQTPGTWPSPCPSSAVRRVTGRRRGRGYASATVSTRI